jgi:hypothetical protein
MDENSLVAKRGRKYLVSSSKCTHFRQQLIDTARYLYDFFEGGSPNRWAVPPHALRQHDLGGGGGGFKSMLAKGNLWDR